MDLGTVLHNIDLLLKADGRKADGVSRAAGVPDAIRNIRRVVKGEIKSTPNLRTITALATELGVSVDYLTQPRRKPEIKPMPGLREAILQKIQWLDQQKKQALEELAALEEAESAPRKPLKRKMR